ncbi:hypothetical protein HDU76_003151 [Blyttiomyces sp. JEL0837]|nr:hypothetical protein HDU76_003151 [Blyttiomyces sp. JEL0837]
MSAQDAMNTSLTELASESRKETSTPWKPRFPISCVVMALVIVALAAVCVPLGSIMSITANKSIDELSSIVMAQAVNNTFQQVQEVIIQPRKILQVAVSNQGLQNALVNNMNNLKSESSSFQLLMALTASTKGNGVDCVTYPNLRGGTTNTAYPNATFFGVYKETTANSLENDLYIWMDDSTGPYLNFYNPPTSQVQSPSGKLYDFNFAQTLLFQPWYQHMLNLPNDTAPFYGYNYNYGDLLSSVSQVVWTSASTTIPSFTCSVGFKNAVSLDPLFDNIKVTANTHVFMMDVNNGNLLANSVPHTVSKVANYTDPLRPVIQFTPDTTNDTTVNAIGQVLRSRYGNYSLVPNTGSTITFETTMNGQSWFINLKHLDEPINWMLVVAIPRSDFFEKTDNAGRLAIILSVVIGVVGILLAALASWIAMRPLHQLTKAMENLTKLDFSALEGDILNSRSLMAEVRDLQTTFATMCKAFASGIRRNKALTAGGYGGSTTKSTGGIASSYN